MELIDSRQDEVQLSINLQRLLTLVLALHFTFSSISFLCKSANRESPIAFCVSRNSSTGLSRANSTTLSCGRNCKLAQMSTSRIPDTTSRIMATAQHACSQNLVNRYLAQVIQLNIQLLHLVLDISHDNRLPCMVNSCQLILLSALLDLPFCNSACTIQLPVRCSSRIVSSLNSPADDYRLGFTARQSDFNQSFSLPAPDEVFYNVCSSQELQHEKNCAHAMHEGHGYVTETAYCGAPRQPKTKCTDKRTFASTCTRLNSGTRPDTLCERSKQSGAAKPMPTVWTKHQIQTRARFQNSIFVCLQDSSSEFAVIS